jgi:glycosyl-4,4'-diaponeurosporenoate acyltransferase
MSVLALSTPVTIAVDVVAWAAISAGTGYFVHRLPPSAVDHDRWVHRERGFERGGALYVRVFRIRRWKHWLPEAGALFRGGYDKSRLPVRRADAYRRYAAETRRAELGHWLALAAGPAFFLWNPWPAGLLLQVYAIVANGPCILSQRYNRLRVQRALARMA